MKNGLAPDAAHGFDAMLRSKGNDPAVMSLSIIFNMIAHVSEIIDTCAIMEADGPPRISLADWACKRTRQRVVVLQHDPSNRVKFGIASDRYFARAGKRTVGAGRRR